MTKDPIGHKGSRLTAQISLPGRFLVYVPDGSMTGISRKLPDTERTRLKAILKTAVPEGAGVIVRTAAEGASEEELARDVARLNAQWEDIAKKAKTGTAPALLYGEPDLAVRVIRDVFNEDVNKLVVSGDDAWDIIQPYLGHVAPDLVDRLSRWTDEKDVFAAHRVDEQLAKALDRKVWLPSGGSLVIDRTEAMTVVDVNTGKFTGAGGNLEETVTRNNLEAAEEIVRQLRLRDVGGIIVVDFIDMVLESNRDLVLRRLLECLSRDRTKHQVAEVTSLGLVQMTRKRVGQGLIEAFSETVRALRGPRREGPDGAGRPQGQEWRLPEAPAPQARRQGQGRRSRGVGTHEAAADAAAPEEPGRSRATPPPSRSPRLLRHSATGVTTTQSHRGARRNAGLRGWPPPPTLEPDLGNASGGIHGSARPPRPEHPQPRPAAGRRHSVPASLPSRPARSSPPRCWRPARAVRPTARPRSPGPGGSGHRHAAHARLLRGDRGPPGRLRGRRPASPWRSSARGCRRGGQQGCAHGGQP